LQIGAFGKIIASVEDVIMPIVGLLTGVDFTQKFIALDATIMIL
jgi:large-conductance mechanosensitive channel